MPYDDPSLKEFDNYYQARSASKRERAENWAVAIGLQNANIFAEHSWFFRNALVRANYENPLKGYHRDREPLERFFRNLIMGERNEILSRRNKAWGRSLVLIVRPFSGIFRTSSPLASSAASDPTKADIGR